MKKALVLLFAVGLSARALGGLAKWTVMVYIDGDCDLEEYAIQDINEMEYAGGSTTDVRLVVLFDRHPDYDSSNGDWADCRRGEVMADPNADFWSTPIVSELTPIGEVNMGDRETLRQFIDWAAANYPAQKYMLILWNHGGGWRAEEEHPGPFKGVCYDDTSNHDGLYIKEVRQAVESSTLGQVDVIGFDACLMATAEVAYEMRNVASYMVGSEKTEPGYGWPYDVWCKYLVQNPDLTAVELAQVVVAAYGAWYEQVAGRKHETQSATDLSNVADAADACSAFAQAMVQLDSDTEWANLDTARQESWDFKAANLYDLHTVLDRFAAHTSTQSLKQKALAARDTVESAMICAYGTSPDGKPAKGLSVMVNPRGYQPDPAYDSLNILWARDTQWDEMLQKLGLSGPLTGPDLADYSTMGASPVFSPGVVWEGRQTSITATVMNRGNVDAGPFKVWFLLRKVGSSEWYELDKWLLWPTRRIVTIGGVTAGANTEVTTGAFGLPSGIPAGEYHVHVVYDCDGDIAELYENNNEVDAQATLTVINASDAKSDLTSTGTPYLSPPVIRPGTDTLDVACGVQNIGYVDAGAYQASFYLSADTTLDGGDTFIGQAPSAGLPTGSAEPLGGAGIDTTGWAEGTYYIIYWIDSANSVDELSETNNLFAMTQQLTVAAAPTEPDLKTSSVDVTETLVAPGDTVQVAVSVLNDSTNAVGADFQVTVRVSSDATIDASDAEIGRYTISGGLGAGATHSQGTFGCALPETLTTGTYYIGAIADCTDAVLETDEANNAGAVVDTLDVDDSLVRPDLVDDSWGWQGFFPEAVAPGGALQAWCYPGNYGLADAGAFDVTFYLSVDQIVDGSDLELGTVSVTGLTVNEWTEALLDLASFPVVADGSYWIVWMIDPSDAVSEKDETNNTAVMLTQIVVDSALAAADLVDLDVDMAGFWTFDPTAEGLDIEAWCYVWNRGLTDAVANVDVDFFLSTDTTIDLSDYWLGWTTITGGVPAESYDLAYMPDGVVTAGIPAGTYYIGWIIDALDLVPEAYENNNTACITDSTIEVVPPAPELFTYIDHGFSPQVAYAGMSGFQAWVDVGNYSDVAAGVFDVAFYLSSDTTLDGFDTLLGTAPVAGLPAWTYDTATLNVGAFPAVSVGTYHVIWSIDSASAVAEMDESNNVQCLSYTLFVTTPLPDLEEGAGGVTFSATPVLPGDAWSAQTEITNAGAADAGSFAVKFYLSSDTTLGLGDALLGSDTVPSLLQSASTTATLNLTSFPAQPAGVYYVICEIDPTNSVGELDEADNVCVSASTLTVNPGTPPQFTSSPPTEGTEGVAYTHTPTATGTPDPTVFVSGLPGWLSWNGTTLSGTPAAGDVGITGTITLTASNGVAPDAVQQFQITVAAESVSMPSAPTGSASGITGESLAFSTGGASCNAGHPVEYSFDFGDGTISAWSAATSAAHSYAAAGTYDVKAQARCSVNTSVVSAWSTALSVTVSKPSNGGNGGCGAGAAALFALAVLLGRRRW